MCLGSSEASFREKTSAKSEYSVRIEVGALFAINTAICALQEEWTSSFWLLLGLLIEATYTMKILCPGSRVVAANSFFPTSLTCLVVRRASSIV